MQLHVVFVLALVTVIFFEYTTFLNLLKFVFFKHKIVRLVDRLQNLKKTSHIRSEVVYRLCRYDIILIVITIE